MKTKNYQIVYKPFIVKPVHKLMIKWLRHKGHITAEWEKSFLKDIKNKTKFSPKQLSKLNEIYYKVRRGVKTFLEQDLYE